jgi:hypothetical protein
VTPWCDPAHLAYGDFAGDGKTDLICNSGNGMHIVATPNIDGSFTSGAWWPGDPNSGVTPWCDPAHLAYGDFAGDGKTDLICNSDNGMHIVATAKGDGSFDRGKWWPGDPESGVTPWCDPAHRAYGDFAGDGKTDLICNSDNGMHIVATAKGDGRFDRGKWWPGDPDSGKNGWCDPAHLAYGDFDGNGKTDLICNSEDRMHSVARADSAGNFTPEGWWPNPTGSGKKGWCAAHLAYGDFDGDGNTDLICNSDDGRHIVANHE